MRTRTSTAGNRGFTLLELVVVLFIIGLVSSVVIVSVGRLHDSAKFQNEARLLFLTLKQARESALFRRKEIIFRLDAEANRFQLVDGQAALKTHSLPPGFTISGEEEIIFFAKGNSSGGKITIDNGKGRRYEIQVDAALGTPSFSRL